MPLTSPAPANVKLCQIDGLRGWDHTFLGVVVSHPHFDHHGLIQKAPSSIHIFIGSAAEKILRAAILFGSFGVSYRNVTHYEHRVFFEVGPFLITPFLNDHSAFDVYSFLVEAAGKFPPISEATVARRASSTNF